MKGTFYPFRKKVHVAIMFLMLLPVLFIFSVVFALRAVDKTTARLKTEFPVANSADTGWANPEARELKKDIYWLEQLLLVSNSDSISMGICLADSTIQVQLKGTVLFQSKIVNQFPRHFLNSLDAESYRNFGKVAVIESGKANMLKKPIKKVTPPNTETVKTVAKPDSVKDERLTWYFHSGNNIDVVVYGLKMNEDFTFSQNTFLDIMQHRVSKNFDNPRPHSYSPTLFLWIDDRDARAIYRAIPENGKVIFRN